MAIVNNRYIYNPNLVTKQAETGDVTIMDLSVSNLQSLGFLDSNGWPTSKLLTLMNDIDSMSPSMFNGNVKIWDQLFGSPISIYNKFIEDDVSTPNF